MRAWCPSCLVAEYVDETYRCLWCRTVTLSILKPDVARPSRCIPEETLRMAHARYAAGENARLVARDLRTWRDSLLRHWWALGLPTRSRAASNALEARRRRKTGKSGAENHFYRSDLSDADILAAHAATGSMQRAAEVVGCSLSTVSRRMRARA